MAEVENVATGPGPSEKILDMIERFKGFTVLELVEFVKAFEEAFGVKAQAPMAAMAPMGAVPGAGEAAPAVEEKTTFDVVLKAAGANKIQVIKVVRTIATNLGLKEAKNLVEEAPKAVKEGVPKDEAEKIKKDLEAVGATVEIK